MIAGVFAYETEGREKCRGSRGCRVNNLTPRRINVFLRGIMSCGARDSRSGGPRPDTTPMIIGFHETLFDIAPRFPRRFNFNRYPKLKRTLKEKFRIKLSFNDKYSWLL